MKEKELWKPMKENPIYQISSKGRVKSFRINKRSGRKILGSLNKTTNRINFGILTKAGRYKSFMLHSLVAKYFIPNPHKHKFVKFLDGDKTNCNANNLAWCPLNDTFIRTMPKAYPRGSAHARTGTKVPKALRKKLKLCNKGRKHKDAIYIINNVVYRTLTSASNAIGVSQQAIAHRFKVNWDGYHLYLREGSHGQQR